MDIVHIYMTGASLNMHTYCYDTIIVPPFCKLQKITIQSALSRVLNLIRCYVLLTQKTIKIHVNRIESIQCRLAVIIVH